MKTTRTFDQCDRYVFDWDICQMSEGWAQVDTPQDASYFGQWANPLTLKIMSYAEGDVCYKEADSPDEFVEELISMRDWHHEQGEKFAIDGMCCDKIIAAFKSIGAGDMLH